METEILENVLTEILDELKALKLQQSKQVEVFQSVTDKVDGFHTALLNIKVSRVIDTQPLAQSIKSGIDEIKNTIEEQPKPIVRQFRFLLFPEFYADHYYRIVFGRLLFWMMIFIIATYFFVLGKQFLSDHAKQKQLTATTDSHRKAWNYLYEKGNKSLKKKMDTIWIETRN